MTLDKRLERLEAAAASRRSGPTSTTFDERADGLTITRSSGANLIDSVVVGCRDPHARAAVKWVAEGCL